MICVICPDFLPATTQLNFSLKETYSQKQTDPKVKAKDKRTQHNSSLAKTSTLRRRTLTGRYCGLRVQIASLFYQLQWLKCSPNVKKYFLYQSIGPKMMGAWSRLISEAIFAFPMQFSPQILIIKYNKMVIGSLLSHS